MHKVTISSTNSLSIVLQIERLHRLWLNQQAPISRRHGCPLSIAPYSYFLRHGSMRRECLILEWLQFVDFSVSLLLQIPGRNTQRAFLYLPETRIPCIAPLDEPDLLQCRLV